MSVKKGKTYFVDLPDPRDLEAPMVNMGEFDTREEAVEFCAKHFGAVNGKLDLITAIDKEEGDEDEDSE